MSMGTACARGPPACQSMINLSVDLRMVVW